MWFTNISTRLANKNNKQNVLLLIAIIGSLIIMYYTYTMVSPNLTQKQEIDYSLSNNHAMNIIHKGNEGFQSEVSSTVAGTTTTSAGTTTTAAPTPARTLSTVELAL